MAKEKTVVKSKKWQCSKCGGTFSNPIPCLAVTCAVCTRKSRGVPKWMSPVD